MKRDYLKLPNNYIIDNTTIEKLKDYLLQYIIRDANKLHNEGIDVYLHPNSFRIKYNKHIYWLTVVKDITNNYYWYLRPYENNYLVFDFLNQYNDFQKILLEIKEVKL